MSIIAYSKKCDTPGDNDLCSRRVKFVLESETEVRFACARHLAEQVSLMLETSVAITVVIPC